MLLTETISPGGQKIWAGGTKSREIKFFMTVPCHREAIPKLIVTVAALLSARCDT